MGIIRTLIMLFIIFVAAFIFVKGYFVNKELTKKFMADASQSIRSAIQAATDFAKLATQVFSSQTKEEK